MSDDERELLWYAISYGGVVGLSVVVVASLWAFVPALRRRWLPLRRLRPGHWAGNEVVFAFGVLVGFPMLVAVLLLQLGVCRALLGPAPEPDANNSDSVLYFLRISVISSPLTLTLSLATLFGVLFARTRTRPHQYGLSWARWPANLGLGLLGFVGLTPFILALFKAATVIFWTREQSIALVGRATLLPLEWCLMAFQVTVAAPLMEEIVFRGILQGWLRRASLAGHVGVALATLGAAALGISYYDPNEKVEVFDPSLLVFAVILVGGHVYSMLRLKRRFALTEDEVRAWSPLESPPQLNEEADAESRRRDEQRLQDRAGQTLV